MVRDILSQTLLWFQKAVPQPASKNFHTQLGCHFEEVNEMIQAIGTEDFETSVLLEAAVKTLHNLAVHLKTHDSVVFVEDRIEFLDGLCDQVVTATGCAYMARMAMIGAMAEVNRSNFSKFDESGEPIFDPNMKVMKGADYTKPDLTRFV